jgi:hypothetical protein
VRYPDGRLLVGFSFATRAFLRTITSETKEVGSQDGRKAISDLKPPRVEYKITPEGLVVTQVGEPLMLYPLLQRRTTTGTA